MDAVREQPDVFGEVELGPAAPELEGSLIVRSGSCLGRTERAQPYSGSFVRVPDLCRPFAPGPLPYSPVLPPPLSTAATSLIKG